MPAPSHDDPSADPVLARLTILSDGVFAIAMTLLAVELHLPDSARGLHRFDLLHSILSTWPQVFAFIQSFLVLALYWVGHHQSFRYIRRSNGAFVWLNLAYLLTLAFLPYPTSILGAHFLDPAAVTVYFLSLLVSSAIGTAIWWYASSQGLVPPTVDAALIHRTKVASALGPAVFLLLTLLSLWDLVMSAGTIPLIAGIAAGYLLALGYLILSAGDFWETR